MAGAPSNPDEEKIACLWNASLAKFAEWEQGQGDYTPAKEELAQLDATLKVGVDRAAWIVTARPQPSVCVSLTAAAGGFQQILGSVLQDWDRHPPRLRPNRQPLRLRERRARARAERDLPPLPGLLHRGELQRAARNVHGTPPEGRTDARFLGGLGGAHHAVRDKTSPDPNETRPEQTV